MGKVRVKKILNLLLLPFTLMVGKNTKASNLCSKIMGSNILSHICTQLNTSPSLNIVFNILSNQDLPSFIRYSCLYDFGLTFKIAIYLFIRFPTPNLENKSPFGCLFHSKPNNSKLKIFGCLCYPWLCPYTSHKIEQCSKACLFLGNSHIHNSYIYFELIDHKFYISSHVQFDKTSFLSRSIFTKQDKIYSHTLSCWSSISQPLDSLSTSTHLYNSNPLNLENSPTPLTASSLPFLVSQGTNSTLLSTQPFQPIMEHSLSSLNIPTSVNLFSPPHHPIPLTLHLSICHMFFP